MVSVIYAPMRPGLDDAERRSELHFVYAPLATAVCFYCLGDLAYPVVQWHGEGDIFLHADCAQRLALHLAKDGLLAEKALRTVAA